MDPVGDPRHPKIRPGFECIKRFTGIDEIPAEVRPAERPDQSLDESYKLAVGGEPVAADNALGVLAKMFPGNLTSAGLIKDKHHRHGRDEDPQPPAPALFVARLDKVHPTGLVNMPVVFAAIDFRQQEIEAQQR